MAGVKMSSGDALINIDIDLQDPPSLIPKMVKHWRDDNFDVVFTTRLKDMEKVLLKRLFHQLVIKFLSYLLMLKWKRFW